jgi:hypothetical protein
VPSGTTGYRVKYSDRNIVDWLGFDQATRTYQYSPSSYVSWFAAQSAAGEPAPLPGGSVQTMTVSGLDPSKTFRFSVRFTTTVPDFTPPASARDLSAH